MPDDLDRFYLTRDLLKLFKCSRGMIFGRINKGKFPLPCKFGGENYWLKKEIDPLLKELKEVVPKRERGRDSKVF